MDYDSQTDAFRFDLDSMVDRYLEEFDINSITIIGALQEKVYELSQGGNIVFKMDSEFWEFDFDDIEDSDDLIEEDS
tara:strand:- start:4221 stop:4451 length:231 start_codon:yes stop_codon:yes gene_type:complete